MKKDISFILKSLLAAVLTLSIAFSGVFIGSAAETDAPAPILTYDFESGDGTDSVGDNDAVLHGGAKVEDVSATGSKALYLNGSSSYLEFPVGFFDGRTKMTLSLDVCSQMDNDNFFTVAIGKDTNKYLFLRTRANEFRYAITESSWTAEHDVLGSGNFKNVWTNVTLVMNGSTMQLYIDGECVDEQTGAISMSKLGSDLLGYIGKSFYDGDKYFKGHVDNVKVYDKALSDITIAEMLGVKITPFREVKSSRSHIITSKENKETKTLDVYVSKSQTKNHEEVRLRFTLQPNVEMSTDGDLEVKFGTPTTVDFTVNGEKETWTVNAYLCGNPVLDGEFSDPDIDVFGDKYYLYTTSDGFPGWSGTEFHVFSSSNLVDWKDEGVILDCGRGKDVKWAVGSAWAPTIEEKDGKYYFYFCAKDNSGTSHIGVAVADSPTGPFTPTDEPIMTVDMCKKRGVSMGQAIDPSIFTDDDGKSYMLFGNGAAAIVELNEDMISCNLKTLKNYSNVTDFREAITVTKRDGVYHFTWSCDDTGSPNYRVNYGTSDSIYGPIRNRGTILEKDPENDILGTGHHSVLQIPGEDEFYIAYHRFYTPLGHFTDGTGHHRQTCIDKITFDSRGYMEKVTPTLEGVEPRYLTDEPVTPDTGDDEPEAPATSAPADDSTAATDTAAPTENGGCGGTLTSVIAVIVSVFGAALIKRKEDRQ